jgi:O-antigen/teichoic acid export membrane protein
MRLIKGVGTLTLGNIISQGIMFLGVVFLSRLYSPENFGEYAVVFGFVTIVSAVSSLRYEMTILLPKQKRLSQLALQVSFCISCLINLIGLLITIVLIYYGVLLFYWIVVPISAFFSSIINIGSFLQNRNLEYKRIIIIQISRAALFVGIAMLLSYGNFFENGLIVAMVLSLFLPASFLIALDFRKENIFESMFSQRRLVFWVKKNIKFLHFTTPAVFVSSLATQAPIFLLSTLVEPVLAGYYSMVQRVVMAPVILISSAVNKIYMQSVASRRTKKQKIYPFTKKLVTKFLFPSIFLSLIMSIVFHYKFLEMMFGNQWSGIDSLAMVMIPAFLISFIAKSISGFSVLGRNEIGLIYQIVLLVLVSSAVLLSVMISGDWKVVFASVSFALSVCYLGQLIYILKISMKIDSTN